MARGKNTFSLAAGFNITGQQPIDSRLVVDNVADLYLADTWSGVGLYNGLVVAIKSTGSLFVLKDRDNYTATTSWVAVGGDVSADLQSLTGRVSAIETKVTPASTSGLEISNNALAVKIDADTNNALKVTENGLKVIAPDYNLTKLDAPAEDYAAQYEFKKDGEVVTTINIPKDQFLKDASYNADADKLVFVFNTIVDGVYTEKTVDVDVADLVDTYTGSDYIEVSSNQISVKYDALKNALTADLKATFAIDTLTKDIADNKTAIAGLQSDLNTEGTGIKAVVADNSSKIGALESAVGGLDTKVTNHGTAISGIQATIADIKVRNVNTEAVHGIALTHTDAQGEDGVNDTVGISVDLDTLAAAVIAKHEVPSPDAVNIKVTAAGSFTTDTNVQAAIENLDSRIKAAVSGGVTSVVAGNGISVNASDVNNPTVSVNTSALIAENSALSVVDNKIDLIWAEL